MYLLKVGFSFFSNIARFILHLSTIALFLLGVAWSFIGFLANGLYGAILGGYIPFAWVLILIIVSMGVDRLTTYILRR